ncbi:MAG: response regulator transcription factor [Deltaproteobacteria bacterium]|nr:response regulator transcription factor [Deltaproteobacteria bacterium]
MKLETNPLPSQNSSIPPSGLQPRPFAPLARPTAPARSTGRPRRHLTDKEKQILRLICDGLTNPAIAASLSVSRETVKSELKRIFRKINVSNRTQAAVLLVKQGWL